MREPVLILIGSKSDWEIMREAGAVLDSVEVDWQVHVSSAHRALARTVELVRRAEVDGVKVFVCGAGMAAHLAGVVAASTVRPVIGVPLAGGIADGLDALLSTVQMPAGVPVATVAAGKAGARNAGILAAAILATTDEALATRLGRLKQEMAEAVAAADDALQEERRSR
ncbi:MAG: 5-(carboxyamino)imidazole ribonucleotide mutase [Thermoanaerobaculales bacterium]